MTLFAGKAIFMFTGSLVPGFREMLIAAATAPAVRNKNALTGCCEIGDGLAGLGVENKCSDRNLQNHVFAGVARAVGALAVPPAIGFEFAIVTVAEKGVVVDGGFEIDAAAISAITAGRTAARNGFFAAQGHATGAAAAGLHEYFGFLNKHRNRALFPPTATAGCRTSRARCADNFHRAGPRRLLDRDRKNVQRLFVRLDGWQRPRKASRRGPAHRYGKFESFR